MLNNFISGGQVFLHKIRMFKQVTLSSLFVSLFIGVLATGFIKYKDFNQLNKAKVPAAWGYAKANISIYVDEAVIDIFPRSSEPKVTINTYNYGKRDLYAKDIIKSNYYKNSFNQVVQFAEASLILVVLCTCGAFILVLYSWARFGKSVKSDKRKDDSIVVLTPEEVRSKLRSLKMASDLTIGRMPLVKDMETMNFLISGAMGSGKTNLMHILIPQIIQKNQPAVIVDNTGEMIAKYYNKERGDIIFNPFDERSHAWNFWKDCSRLKDLEKFADILIGFNSKRNHREASDFWEASAQSIFVAFADTIRQKKDYSIESLYKILCSTDSSEMHHMLKGTDAAKHFSKDNERTAASIMSVLMSNIKPLRYARDNSKNGRFSIEDYLNKINAGGNSLLFFASDPSARELTTPLNAALLELLISRMRRTRTNTTNKLWVVMDELPSLGNLPGLPQLMQEGRKYGACVIAGLQSTSQLYKHYGDADSSNLIGLFKTKFMFASDDPRMGELYSKLCGNSTIITQQKNTSFGANEFRDGVSYNEKKENIPLVSYEEFGRLNIGECYTLLPLAPVRLSKMQVPEARVLDKNSWFIESKEDVQENIPLDKVPETEDDIAIEHITNSIPEPQKELDREEKSKKLTPEIN